MLRHFLLQVNSLRGMPSSQPRRTIRATQLRTVNYELDYDELFFAIDQAFTNFQWM